MGSKIKPLVWGNTAGWDNFHIARLFFFLISQLICCGRACYNQLAPSLVTKRVCQTTQEGRGNRTVFFDGGLLCQGKDLHRKGLIHLLPCTSSWPEQSECIRLSVWKTLVGISMLLSIQYCCWKLSADVSAISFLVPWCTWQQNLGKMQMAHLFHQRV